MDEDEFKTTVITSLAELKTKVEITYQEIRDHTDKEFTIWEKNNTEIDTIKVRMVTKESLFWLLAITATLFGGSGVALAKYVLLGH